MSTTPRRLIVILGVLPCLVAGCQSGMPTGPEPMASTHPSGTGMSSGMHGGGATLESRFAAARNMENSGDTAGAIAEYRELAQMYPDQPTLWHRLAVAYNKMEQLEQATECYRIALSLDQNNPELLCDCGYAQFLQGNLSVAEGYCRRALQLNPAMQRARNNLGLILAKTGQPAAAIEQFRMAGLDSAQADRNLRLASQMMIPNERIAPDRMEQTTQMMASTAPPSMPTTVQPPPAAPPENLTFDYTPLAAPPSALTADQSPRAMPQAELAVEISPPVVSASELTADHSAPAAPPVALAVETAPTKEILVAEEKLPVPIVESIAQPEPIEIAAPEMAPEFNPMDVAVTEDAAFVQAPMADADQVTEPEQEQTLAALPPPQILPDTVVSKPQPLRPMPLPLAMVIANQTIANLVPPPPAVDTADGEMASAERVAQLNYYATDPSTRKSASNGRSLCLTDDCNEQMASTRSGGKTAPTAKISAKPPTSAVALMLGDSEEPASTQKAAATSTLPGVVRRLGDIE